MYIRLISLICIALRLENVVTYLTVDILHEDRPVD